MKKIVYVDNSTKKEAGLIKSYFENNCLFEIKEIDIDNVKTEFSFP